MLGLRYLTCPDCGTVYARPADDDTGCWRCGADRLTPVPSDPAADAYFTDGRTGRTGE